MRGVAVKKESDLGWKDIEKGSIVTEPGSAAQYSTGGWKSKKPVFDLEKCTKCGLCFLYCPEGCIQEMENGFFQADMFYCKGCGICAKECPRDVISMVEEAS